MGEEPGALVPTPRYEKVLRMAEEEARRRGHLYVGVEHLMLAILAEDGSLPAQVLRGIGATAPFTDAIERTMASRAYGPPPDPAR